MIGEVYTEGGTKKVREISGAIPTGLPVGTWISFEHDQAPDNKWVQAGTTFDPTVYPSLYLFLGGNAVPERFDHNRLEMEILASNTTLDWMKGADKTKYYECPYDGYINLAKSNTTGSFNIYVETSVDRGQTWQITTAELSCGGGGITIPVTKGTFVRGNSTQYNLYYNYATAWWYKHPMFIKATSAIEITDQDTFLQTVEQSVAQGQSYSTQETLTGGTWIDGKPIYRKVVDCGALPNNTAKTVNHNISNLGTVVKLAAYTSDGNEWMPLPEYYSNAAIGMSIDATIVYLRPYSNRTSWTTTYAIIEYTKTTD